MNIVKRELRAHLKSLIIWSVCILLFTFMETSEFSAYHNNPEMAAILDTMPQAMLKAFSMSGANLTTIIGFVSILAVFFYIMLGIYAVLLGSSIISKEERDKTAEYLFTLPVTRRKVIVGKLIASIILCLIILGVTGLSITASVMKYNPSESFYEFLGLMLLAIFIIQMIFMSVGMLLASVLKQYKKSGSVSIAILLGTYILSVMIGLSDKIDFLKYFTPFKYFEAVYIVNESKLELVYVLISVVVIVGSVFGTLIFYKKRDLHI